MSNDITALMATMKPGKYAILYRDNWDGEGDTYHCLASLSADGKWHDEEFNAELLQFEGDEILKAWPLDDGSNVLALVEALEAAEQKLAAVECELHDAENVAEDRQLRIRDIENRQRTEYDECVLTKTRLAFDLAAANRRVAELESRTVTVKLPLAVSVGGQGYREQVVDILAAAGIQVIEGEGQ